MIREHEHALGGQWEPNALGLYLPPRAKRRYDRPVAIDLFAGAGGFSLGFHQAGFHVVAALEYDYAAAMTYCVNLARPGVRFHFDTPERAAGFDKALRRELGITGKPNRHAGVLVHDDGTSEEQLLPEGFTRGGMLAGDGWISHQPTSEPACEHMWVADAANVTGAEILDAIGLDVGDVDCVFGGPPCQGFSIAGKRNVVDPRNALVFEFARIVCEIAPRAFVMENVPGIASMTTPDGLPVLDALSLYFADHGMGGYEALRRSLASTAGLGAAVKGAHKARNAHSGTPAEPDEDEDAAMFRQEALL